MTHKPFDDLDIDFYQLLEQEPEFKAFCSTVIMDAFTTFNPHLLPTLWAIYQSGMKEEAAGWTLKQLIRFGGPPNGQQPPRRDSKG